jgi:hypothetical protein
MDKLSILPGAFISDGANINNFLDIGEGDYILMGIIEFNDLLPGSLLIDSKELSKLHKNSDYETIKKREFKIDSILGYGEYNNKNLNQWSRISNWQYPLKDLIVYNKEKILSSKKTISEKIIGEKIAAISVVLEDLTKIRLKKNNPLTLIKCFDNNSEIIKKLGLDDAKPGSIGSSLSEDIDLFLVTSPHHYNKFLGFDPIFYSTIPTNDPIKKILQSCNRYDKVNKELSDLFDAPKSSLYM